MTNQWIVVIRKARNHETERGTIVARNLSEKHARSVKAEIADRESMHEFNVWAMPATSY